ncbi:hypothetical protein FACS1894164_10970 [Spirochaetia bacterium]|nr:hypothetical protein FACS1894164_10970 [Spirochaetia bacterium]
MAKFEVNFQDLFFLDINPLGSDRQWERLAAGISSMAPATNESVDQSTYLDGDGYGSSDVIGAQLVLSASGHRKVGDPAQDYIAGIEFELGDERKTNFKYFNSLGEEKGGPCTIANIQIGGGDAAGKKEIAFEIHINGKPYKKRELRAPALTATVAPGIESGTTTITATAGTGNSIAYRFTSSPLVANVNSYPGALTAYETGVDIPAKVGQTLNIFEIDENNRVVQFKAVTLTASDISTVS